MAYEHGITVEQKPYTLELPVDAMSAVQVAFGTAPVHLAENPNKVINEPILIRSFEEAKRKLGYSDDWESYTLCQVMDIAFKRLKVSPVVFINSLDPAVHKELVENVTAPVVDKTAKIDHEGILLNTLVVKSGIQTFTKDIDYLADFDEHGKVSVVVLAGGSIPAETSTLEFSFEQIKPEKVKQIDIIGGYDDANNKYKGIETLRTVYPKLGVVPGLLIAPGWSHYEDVGTVLAVKSRGISGSFNAMNILDVTGTKKENAIDAKFLSAYNDGTSLVCWPKVKIGEKVYWYSAYLASVIAKTDAENDDVPFKSPSNKRIPISAMVNDAGEELFLDQIDGNVLNEKGIVTAINMVGWRVWGNSTAAYEYGMTEIEIKDRFIPLRRMFDWWGNSFIINYFNKVDEPANYRLIESIVDSENIRANGFQAAGQIAGAKIEFRREDNPVEQIQNGKIQFIQKIAFFTPAENIVNVLEFDPTILMDSLFGGEQ